MGNVRLAVHPNAYPDVRRPEWEQYEKAGFVTYDPLIRSVRIDTVLEDVLNVIKRSKTTEKVA